ncbi:MAG: ABC transporter ATP-binding protein, partial [Flavobacteriales bacterium]
TKAVSPPEMRISHMCALGIETPILLLDEPFAHLDQELEARVQTMISTCARDYQRTILFTAHREVSFHEETQMLEL